MKYFVKASIIMALVIAATTPAQATNRWFYGPVTQVITLHDDGSFFVYIDNVDIKSSCDYDRVSFEVSDMGAERTKAALSMALSAFAADRQFGVVIDFPPSGTACKASSTATQGAGIKN
ncbi:MAG: hypothetical protein AAGA68_07125 [Pseudomonadota bacterium]